MNKLQQRIKNILLRNYDLKLVNVTNVQIKTIGEINITYTCRGEYSGGKEKIIEDSISNTTLLIDLINNP